jgi:hypothetical protein
MSTPTKPVSAMIVKELKEELQKRSLSTSGLKADLAKRLEEAIKSEQEQAKGKGEANGHGTMSSHQYLFTTKF